MRLLHGVVTFVLSLSILVVVVVVCLDGCMPPDGDAFSDGSCAIFCVDDSVLLAGFREGAVVTVGCLDVSEGAACPHRLPFFVMTAVMALVWSI